MTTRQIDPRHYLIITNVGRAIPVRIKRSGKQLMERFLDLDFRGLAS